MATKTVLIGERYALLTVVERCDKYRDLEEKEAYRCNCECGNEKIVFKNDLIYGGVRSCGCLRSKVRVQDLTNQQFGKLTVVKAANKSKNRSQVWICKCECGNICEVVASSLKNGRTRSCGCLLRESREKAIQKVMKKREEYHIDGTDICQLKQDPRINNTSGFVGVTYDITTRSWKAKIQFKKKRYYLGSSQDIETAVLFRKEAEEEIHGKFLEWYSEQKKEVVIN